LSLMLVTFPDVVL